MRVRYQVALNLVAIVALQATPARSNIRLPKVVSSHMVLQRNTEANVWGWADANERVTIEADWLDQPIRVTADSEGNWLARVPTGDAGGPHTLVIRGGNEIHLTDILFGEVWLASGQSNMEMPLKAVSGAYTGILNSDDEIAAADYPQIRLFQAGNFSSKEPLDDVEEGIVMYGIPPAKCQWQPCAPETVPTFASTAYFFARTLHKELNVPIGIIDASWGGTPAEAWTPVDGLKKLGLDAAVQQATTLPQKSNQKIPARLYNGMIHPLRHVTIQGAIWYQGEGNAGRAPAYRDLFTTMIKQWRTAWGREFPFYFVQISPFNYRNVNAAFLREAQLQTLSLKRTGMACTMDIGHLTDIHPKNKQEVGRRLALWALAKDYGREIDFSGPLYRESKREGDAIRVLFDHAHEGLKTLDGKAPSHFEISADGQAFHKAKATIDGSTVVVSSDEVSEPKFVRYAFSSNAQPNLVDKSGLPASSFRTDGP